MGRRGADAGAAEATDKRACARTKAGCGADRGPAAGTKQPARRGTRSHTMAARCQRQRKSESTIAVFTSSSQTTERDVALPIDCNQERH